MTKVIAAIVALIMMMLSIMPASGYSVSYGIDQYGNYYKIYNYGYYAIYDFGLYRYLDFGGGIGHWEYLNRYTRQYELYTPYGNYYGTTSNRPASSSGYNEEAYQQYQEVVDQITDSKIKMWTPNL